MYLMNVRDLRKGEKCSTISRQRFCAHLIFLIIADGIVIIVFFSDFLSRSMKTNAIKNIFLGISPILVLIFREKKITIHQNGESSLKNILGLGFKKGLLYSM